MSSIVVVDHDANWANTFAQLRSNIWAAVADVASSVEHVGGTAVPGLAAKPIIDVTVVVPSAAHAPLAISRLAGIGYVHQGNLAIEGRDAFQAPPSLPRHHLYVCPSNSLALRNHLVVRDYLRAHPDVAQQYSGLKRRLASQYPEDVDAYTSGKTDVILWILKAAGLRSDELEAIERLNRGSAQRRDRQD